jgi:hypothetical protein
MVMVFYATFNNISVILWRSVLLVEESGVSKENDWPLASHWQTLLHNVVSSTLPWAGFKLTTLVVMGTDCMGSYNSNYYTIMTDKENWQILDSWIFPDFIIHTEFAFSTLVLAVVL